MKCKNIECENETKNKNVYCSLNCRNVYVNKYLRDYTKVKETFKIKKERLIEDYYNNPKKCKHCDKEIRYEIRINDFCDSSCSASSTNKNRIVSDETKEKLSNTFLVRAKKEYYNNAKICKYCDEIIKFEKRRNKYCSDICVKENKRKHLSEKKKYKNNCQFKFNLADYDEFDLTLIKEHGWYYPTNKGDNPNGISRDHMYSVTKGFENNIDHRLISHPANCELMRHKLNFKKFTECSITIIELKKKIKIWEDKYGYFYDYDFLNELKNN